MDFLTIASWITICVQIVLFMYHFGKYEWHDKEPRWIEIVGFLLLTFFIVAVTLTELDYEWTKMDTKINSENEFIQYSINYLGLLLMFIGNILFFWFEFYLYKGNQSPIFDNDFQLNNITLNVRDLTIRESPQSQRSNINNNNNNNKNEQKDEAKEEINNDSNNNNDNENNASLIEKVLKRKENAVSKILILNGPFKFVRHPYLPIVLIWEFGYLLATGYWFEYISFILFMLLELVHINSIEKTMIFWYGNEYKNYSRNKNAFIPTCCGKYFCEMSIYGYQCCYFIKDYSRLEQHALYSEIDDQDQV